MLGKKYLFSFYNYADNFRSYTKQIFLFSIILPCRFGSNTILIFQHYYRIIMILKRTVLRQFFFCLLYYKCKAKTSVTQHAMPQNSAESGERNVCLSICLPCYMRGTVWNWKKNIFKPIATICNQIFINKLN